MTKKDYELFASALSDQESRHLADGIDTWTYAEIVVLCCQVFARDNFRFNAMKFKAACYEGKHIRKSIKEG